MLAATSSAGYSTGELGSGSVYSASAPAINVAVFGPFSISGAGLDEVGLDSSKPRGEEVLEDENKSDNS